MPAIKAYKGFNRDMTCHGFQFREGETHELPEGQEAKLCQSGFHACENPVDCLRYYGAGTSVYREVELDATDERHEDDSKRVGSKIKIGAVLDVAKICKLAFEYVKKSLNGFFGILGYLFGFSSHVGIYHILRQEIKPFVGRQEGVIGLFHSNLR